MIFYENCFLLQVWLLGDWMIEDGILVQMTEV